MTSDPYGPLRSQTRAKHDLLRAYLEPFAFKTLQRFGSLDFVDGFAGPWKSEDEDFSDTSFGIAVETLAAVQETLAATGRRPSVRCLFNEEKASSFVLLERFVEQARRTYPHMEFVAKRGRFADNAGSLAKEATNAFRLVFVDPTGWLGYPRDALTELLRHPRSEVIVNFMSSFVDRFFREPEDRRDAWLEQMLGPERAQALRTRQASEEDVRQAVAAMLRHDLGFDYVCESPVAKNEADQVHFWLLYGTRNAMGVEVLRDAEVRALTRHEAAREGHRQGPQLLLEGLPVPGPYSTMRADHLRELPSLICTLASKASKPFTLGVLAPKIMTRRYVRKTEIKDAVAKLAGEGIIQPTWKERSPKARKPADGDSILLTNPASS